MSDTYALCDWATAKARIVTMMGWYGVTIAFEPSRINPPAAVGPQVKNPPYIAANDPWYSARTSTKENTDDSGDGNDPGRA